VVSNLKNRTHGSRPRACTRALRQLALDRPAAVAADHLATCNACRDEVARQRIALNALRAAAVALTAEASDLGGDILSAPRRRAVLSAAGRRPALGWGLLPLLDWRPLAGMAAAAAVTIAVGLSAWSLDPRRMDARGPVEVASVASGLQVNTDGTAVRLKWDSDGRAEHRVIRATDPRRLAAGRVATVRGDEWVDPDTNGARVVFYRVD